MPTAVKHARRVQTIIARLKKAYPDAALALHFTSPFELLIALILAAQCTDEKVNEVTGSLLFRKYRTPADYVRVPAGELEADIHPTGFYRNKTKSIQRCCGQLIERFGGKVPSAFDDLISLPGVGRKTASTNSASPAVSPTRSASWRTTSRCPARLPSSPKVPARE